MRSLVRSFVRPPPYLKKPLNHSHGMYVWMLPKFNVNNLLALFFYLLFSLRFPLLFTPLVFFSLLSILVFLFKFFLMCKILCFFFHSLKRDWIVHIQCDIVKLFSMYFHDNYRSNYIWLVWNEACVMHLTIPISEKKNKNGNNFCENVKRHFLVIVIVMGLSFVR